MSYTCVVNIHSGQSNRATVQFRRAKLNLAATNEAHAIHGPVVPPITFSNIHHQLFVYVSPFAEGQPFINILLSPEGDPPVSQLLKTATHLASMFVGRIQTEEDVLMPANTISIIPDQEPTVRTLNCKSGTRQLISRSIAIIKRNAELVDSLPLVLAHPDLTPFNYLVDRNGCITAVLDWDGATHERLGYNLHFAQYLFGCMMLEGWQDYADRETVDAAYYSAFTSG